MSVPRDEAKLRLKQCEDRRLRVMRGDGVIGILPVEEINQMVEQYRALGESGIAEAWEGLARYHLDPNGLHESIEDAAECACRAVMAGSDEAVMLLARLVASLRSLDLDEPAHAKDAYEAVRSSPQTARDGERLHALGLLTFHGFGTTRDLRRALELQEQSAALGNSDAMFELYALLSTGQAGKKDDGQARAWCLKAAEAGHPRATYNQGAFYASGNGVEKDEARALEWYQKSSEAGNGRASAMLGYMILSGQGCEPDAERAEELFELSADQGFDVESFMDQLGL